MDIAALDYELPASAIAQTPVEPRDAARLLVDDGPGRAPAHRHVRDLPSLIEPGDLVVLNTTRVLRARLLTRRATGGQAEVLLLEPVVGPFSGDGSGQSTEESPENVWEALVRPSARLRPGSELVFGEDLTVVVGEHLGEGRRVVELCLSDAALGDALERHGQVPLPPYITTSLVDPERYQTTYSQHPASVAAPTAGLHLTPDLLAEIRAAGANLAEVELVVGLGTFRPIAAEKVEDHAMHGERYRVPASTMEACERARRVVAVGTTSVRALESVAATGRLEGRTELFLHGDRPFHVVDALLTNFHQPRSSLLALVDAFVGPRWRALYSSALASGYRFLSFGDAMFLRHERG